MYKKLFVAIAALVLFATSAQAQRNKGLTVIDALGILSAGGNTLVGPAIKSNVQFSNELVFSFDYFSANNGSQFGTTRDICITVIYFGNNPPNLRFFNENGTSGYPGDTSNVLDEWNQQERSQGHCVLGVNAIHTQCQQGNDGATCSFAYRIDEWNPDVAP